MQSIKKNLAEYYILFSILFYWFSTANIFNPIAIILLFVFGYQLWKQPAKMGITIGVIYLLLNLYMCLALISELRDFNTVTSDPIQLFVVGTIFLGLNIIAAIALIKKYSKKQELKTV